MSKFELIPFKFEQNRIKKKNAILKKLNLN